MCIRDSLGIVLLVISIYLAYGLTGIPVEWYLLRRPGAEIGVVWYVDILMRFVLFVLGCAWLVLMFNILPGKDNYLAYVGRNTMPVYIFHLVVRQWIKKHGLSLIHIFVTVALLIKDMAGTAVSGDNLTAMCLESSLPCMDIVADDGQKPEPADKATTTDSDVYKRQYSGRGIGLWSQAGRCIFQSNALAVCRHIRGCNGREYPCYC